MSRQRLTNTIDEGCFGDHDRHSFSPLAPMQGLLDRQVTTGGGVRLWVEPERAGRCTVLLAADDLDTTADRLPASGTATGAVAASGGARLLRLTDPDGNRVIVLGR